MSEALNTSRNVNVNRMTAAADLVSSNNRHKWCSQLHTHLFRQLWESNALIRVRLIIHNVPMKEVHFVVGHGILIYQSTEYDIIVKSNARTHTHIEKGSDGARYKRIWREIFHYRQKRQKQLLPRLGSASQWCFSSLMVSTATKLTVPF